MEIKVTPSPKKDEWGERLFSFVVNGVEAKYLPNATGVRPKYQVEVAGKQYFIKADKEQTPLEIDLLNSLPVADKKYFIPMVAFGCEHSVSYIVQEFVEIQEPNAITSNKNFYAIYGKIKDIAKKYDLAWDLTDCKNWGVVNRQPVIYDAVPNLYHNTDE